ncbi:MAG: helix-turn-helix domain-containing protein [Eubacteriales bacterium]
MFDKSIIGAVIAENRRAVPMTQAELADRLMVSHQAVSQWERGDTLPDITLLPAMAEALGIDINALFGEVRSDLPMFGEKPVADAPEVQEEEPEIIAAQEPEENRRPKSRQNPPNRKNQGTRRYRRNRSPRRQTNRKNRKNEEPETTTGQAQDEPELRDYNVESDLVVKCDINSAISGEDIIVDGSVYGDLTAGGDVMVRGFVRGNINAGGDVSVGGVVSGDITAGGDLTLGSTPRAKRSTSETTRLYKDQSTDTSTPETTSRSRET